ncbi:unnamed protein product [Arabidopsis arenosa]|uniref:Branched-chain-amino-acid aminotransferase n=1 Tax=Arabidopsis arenosa TaxID=38785 RepID=A0A8S2B5N3_ARAAE|nr:unnamed protein product [Arabidopsis arenosa]
MGLLLLEKNELSSKYEEIKASVDESDLTHRREQSAYVSALAEAKKREESLKKDVGIAKECISSLEKTLHEMRAECAETKVSAGSTLSEAHVMIEDALKKHADAEAKMRAAEALQAEANRYHRIAERKLKEVESREDDLTRRLASFKSESETKENEMVIERQTLNERRKSLQQEQERLLDAQVSLNQREDHIFARSQELAELEKGLDTAKTTFEEERKAFEVKKSNLEIALALRAKREEAVSERESSLLKKEQELLVAEEKIASKESELIQNVLANQEVILRTRKSDVEAELECKSKSVEVEIESKRRAWELREVDIKQREDLVGEKEHDLEVQSRALAEKEKDITEKSYNLEEKEKNLIATEKDINLKTTLLESEKERLRKLDLELQQSLISLEDKRKRVDSATQKLEALKSETSELSTLEMKLKEELDDLRAQKLEMLAEADRLKVEKAKFEAEWEHIDVKREELRKEAEYITRQREAFSMYLKDERDNIKEERDALRNQHKNDVESLNREREEFMNKMVEEHSEWLSKIQRERADFLLGIEMQKRELEYCIENKREELENSSRDREKAFEQEKKMEEERIQSLKEMAEKELEHVQVELKRLDAERLEIKLDRERREREWAELKDSVEELKVQREKLETQRHMLRAERDEIRHEIEELKKLENLKVALDDMSMAKMQLSNLERSWEKVSALKQKVVSRDDELDLQNGVSTVSNSEDGYNSSMERQNGLTPSSATPFSWIKRYTTNLIFKTSPEISPLTHHHEEEGGLPSEKLKRESSKREEKAYTEGLSIAVERLEAGRKRRGNTSGDDTSEPSNNKKMKHDVTQKYSDEADTQSVISSPQNVPEDKHELPSSHTQTPSGMVVISETVKITTVTCETEVTNKVTTLECSESPSEAGRKMGEETQDETVMNPFGDWFLEKIRIRHSPSPVSSNFIISEVSPNRCDAVSSSTTGVTELAEIDWDKIDFGLKPTDYMYAMKCSRDGEFSQGQLQPFGNIEINPSAAVLNYGQGLFEGLKAYRKQDGNILLFRPEENAIRMINGAERMCMPSPTVDQFVEAVKTTVLANKRWIPPPGKGSLYIRPLLMGTGAVLGLAPAPEYTFLIFVSPVGNYFKEGVAPINLIVETEFHRATPGGTGGVKTIGNYAAVLKAQSIAKAKGYSDVLYLDCLHKRYLEEVSSCNIFIVKDNVISTPEIKGTILPGITRKSIIEVARSQGFKVEKRNVTVDELVEADEVFCTGTAVVLSPVGSITYKSQRFSYGEDGFGTVSKQLYTSLTSVQMGLSEDNMNWTVQLS